MAALRSLSPDDDVAAELLAAEVHLARLRSNLARTESEPVWRAKQLEQIAAEESHILRLKGLT